MNPNRKPNPNPNPNQVLSRWNMLEQALTVSRRQCDVVCQGGYATLVSNGHTLTLTLTLTLILTLTLTPTLTTPNPNPNPNPNPG